MAYFSNGTEFGIWEQDYCEKCAHDMQMCPVLAVHNILNYDQFKNPVLAGLLNAFIPTGDDGFPAQCKMFIERKEQ